MKKAWLIWPVFFLLLLSSAFAQETIQKTCCMSSTDYKGSMEDLKKELLYNAKRGAVSEIFGEFITSFTKVEQFTLIEDKIRASSAGLIRIKGDPVYYQGKNLGEVCVKIDAYAKKEDFEKFKPKQLSKKTCLMEGDVKTIKGKAQEKAKLEILVDYDQSLKKYPPEKILPLLHEVKYSEGGFVPDTQVYCVRATGTIYPIEIVSIKEELAGATKKEMEKKTGHGKPIGDIAAIPQEIMQKYGDTIPPEILKQYNLDVLFGKRPTIAKMAQGDIFSLRTTPVFKADFVRFSFKPHNLSKVQRDILQKWLKDGHNNVILIGTDRTAYAKLCGVASASVKGKALTISTRHPTSVDVTDVSSKRKGHSYVYGISDKITSGFSVAARNRDGSAAAGMFVAGNTNVYFMPAGYSGTDAKRFRLNFLHWALGLNVPGSADTGTP